MLWCDLSLNVSFSTTLNLSLTLQAYKDLLIFDHCVFILVENDWLMSMEWMLFIEKHFGIGTDLKENSLASMD